MIINVLIEVLIFEAMVSAESLGMMGGLTYSLLKAIARTKAIKFLLNFVTTRRKDVFSETGFHLIRPLPPLLPPFLHAALSHHI